MKAFELEGRKHIVLNFRAALCFSTREFRLPGPIVLTVEDERIVDTDPQIDLSQEQLKTLYLYCKKCVQFPWATRRNVGDDGQWFRHLARNQGVTYSVRLSSTDEEDETEET